MFIIVATIRMYNQIIKRILKKTNNIEYGALWENVVGSDSTNVAELNNAHNKWALKWAKSYSIIGVKESIEALIECILYSVCYLLLILTSWQRALCVCHKYYIYTHSDKTTVQTRCDLLYVFHHFHNMSYSSLNYFNISVKQRV
jgi:hypothetical protein